MLRALVLQLLAVAVGVVCSGCGSSATSPTSPAARGASTTTAAEAQPKTTTAPPPPSNSYSGMTTVAVHHFTFNIDFDITLGTASSNTEGIAPPNVNVVAPLSGTVSIRNTTTAYTASSADLPKTAVFAVYSANSPICQRSGSEYAIPTSPKGPLCGVELAGLAASCSNGKGVPASIAPEATGSLTLWASTDVGSPHAASNPAPNPVGGPAERGECPNYTGHPATSLERIVEGSGVAEQVVKDLDAPPLYWAIVNDAEEQCPAGGGNDGNVLESQPAGLKGCLGGVEH
jgi:hypothetical protein